MSERRDGNPLPVRPRKPVPYGCGCRKRVKRTDGVAGFWFRRYIGVDGSCWNCGRPVYANVASRERKAA